MQEEKEEEQSLCRPQQNRGHMIPHVDTSCIFLGFLLCAPLTFVSVPEQICHVLFLGFAYF